MHSSVYGWNWNGCAGTWDQSVAACNHGPCAGSSSVSYSCSSYSGNWPNASTTPWNANALLDYWTEESGSGLALSGACTASPYGYCVNVGIYHQTIDSFNGSSAYNPNHYSCANGGCTVHMYKPACP